MSDDSYAVCACGMMFEIGRMDDKKSHEKGCDRKFKGYRFAPKRDGEVEMSPRGVRVRISH